MTEWHACWQCHSVANHCNIQPTTSSRGRRKSYLHVCCVDATCCICERHSCLESTASGNVRTPWYRRGPRTAAFREKMMAVDAPVIHVSGWREPQATWGPHRNPPVVYHARCYAVHLRCTARRSIEMYHMSVHQDVPDVGPACAVSLR